MGGLVVEKEIKEEMEHIAQVGSRGSKDAIVVKASTNVRSKEARRIATLFWKQKVRLVAGEQGTMTTTL